MSKQRVFLVICVAFIGAFLTVGFSMSVASMHVTTQESLVHFWLNDGWGDNTFLAPYGKYKHIRSRLDYNFHKAYSRQRVMLQDQIINSMLAEHDALLAQGAQKCIRTSQRWMIFTAGAMGAGKSHTIKELDKKGRFPLQSFLTVDPDQIRHRLPEFQFYVEHNPQLAGELTRKEAGLIAEVLTEVALERGHNVLVDGSLRDADWYMTYIKYLRQTYPVLRLAILHVTAPREAVFQNAMNRAKTTGRVVPRDLLEMSMEQVPKSVALLRPMVDFSVEMRNTGGEDIELASPGMDWDFFTNQWSEIACSARVYVGAV